MFSDPILRISLKPRMKMTLDVIRRGRINDIKYETDQFVTNSFPMLYTDLHASEKDREIQLILID